MTFVQTRQSSSGKAPASDPAGAGSGARVGLVQLCKRYGTEPTLAVDHANLDIAPGEFITLLGPSGSGKTTTLNMIAGFVDVTSGRIDLNGHDISRLAPHKRNFGMVFQNYALFPHMTVFDNIAFPLRQRKKTTTEIRRMVGDVLELVDLTGRDRRKPTELSGGQQQRVALARAVVFSPSLLLLDEPLGALDRKLRQGLQAEIKRIHRELQLTFLFVTHDQEEAMFLSDRIAVFNNGRIERVGTPTTLYNNPGTRFVAEFLGESNVFTGTLTTPTTYTWHTNTWTVPTDQHPPTPTPTDTDTGVALIVRPERIDILDPGHTPPPDHNTVTATVTNVGFLGTVRRVELAYDTTTHGCAILNPTAAPHATPGTTVTLHWHPDHQALVTT